MKMLTMRFLAVFLLAACAVAPGAHAQGPMMPPPMSKADFRATHYDVMATDLTGQANVDGSCDRGFCRKRYFEHRACRAASEFARHRRDKCRRCSHGLFSADARNPLNSASDLECADWRCSKNDAEL